SVDQPAVETSAHILDGDGARAGLKRVIAERKLADLGADGLGRLTLASPTATSVSVAEDAVSPFGLKLSAVSSNLSGATVTGPPATASVDRGRATRSAGAPLRLSFGPPGGTQEAAPRPATTASPPGDNQFTIGANSAATAANLKAALTQALGALGRGPLTAA